MRLLADLHISPRTVGFLRSLGHDVVRVDDILPSTAADEVIVARAIEEGRTVLTQDLDFLAIIALAGKNVPSLISLRLSSSSRRAREHATGGRSANRGERCHRRSDRHGGRRADSEASASDHVSSLDFTPTVDPDPTWLQVAMGLDHRSTHQTKGPPPSTVTVALSGVVTRDSPGGRSG
jgi:predicted nuclease of predicted toxin-antitoxin system